MIRVKIANPYEFDLDFTHLKRAAQTVLEGESITEAKVILAFVDDAHIHRLNKQFSTMMSRPTYSRSRTVIRFQEARW